MLEHRIGNGGKVFRGVGLLIRNLAHDLPIATRRTLIPCKINIKKILAPYLRVGIILAGAFIELSRTVRKIVDWFFFPFNS